MPRSERDGDVIVVVPMWKGRGCTLGATWSKHCSGTIDGWRSVLSWDWTSSTIRNVARVWAWRNPTL